MKPIIIFLDAGLLSVFTHRLSVTLWPFIIISNEYKAAYWLVEHELSLWKDQAETGLVKWLYLHATNRDFRLQTELKALEAAVEHGYPIARAADDLRTCYRLGISYAQAYKLLLNVD